MKIGILTDVHANLPALQMALEVFLEESCKKIFHVGDLIGIGPYPKECVELAFSLDQMEFVMGNHDFWYGNGLPHPTPHWMIDQEVDHQRWTHKQIGDEFKNQVKAWPFSIDFSPSQFIKLNFRHYGLNENQDWFRRIVKAPKVQDLDELFSDVVSDIVFYGHHHPKSDHRGKSRYINVGSAGCYSRAEVRSGILEINDKEYHFRQLSVPYHDNGLMEEFDKRKVPARDFIRKVFIARR